MYTIRTETEVVELKARARYYREFKAKLGVENLKRAFFVAFESMDVDFLVILIQCFAVTRGMSEEKALDLIDGYLDTGKKLFELYDEVAEFLNGGGFFGKLELSDEKSTIDYFKDKLNKIDMDEAIAQAMDGGLKEATHRLVTEKLSEEAKKQNEETKKDKKA